MYYENPVNLSFFDVRFSPVYRIMFPRIFGYCTFGSRLLKQSVVLRWLWDAYSRVSFLLLILYLCKEMGHYLWAAIGFCINSYILRYSPIFFLDGAEFLFFILLLNISSYYSLIYNLNLCIKWNSVPYLALLTVLPPLRFVSKCTAMYERSLYSCVQNGLKTEACQDKCQNIFKAVTA